MIVPDPQASFEFQRTLVLVLDLCGTFAFAVSGATAAVGSIRTQPGPGRPTSTQAWASDWRTTR